MHATRRLALAAVAALPLALAGCDNKCPTENPKIATVPTCPTMAAGAPVTVTLRVCPTCNLSAPECSVVLPNATDPVTIQLDPIMQACDPANSCPPDNSCALNSAVSCSFTTPSASGTYQLLVFDPATGSPVVRDFTVASGGATSCSG